MFIGYGLPLTRLTGPACLLDSTMIADSTQQACRAKLRWLVVGADIVYKQGGKRVQ